MNATVGPIVHNLRFCFCYLALFLFQQNFLPLANMATHTTRLGLGERDRNLARPAMRRNPVDCKNSNRGLLLKSF